MRKYVHHSATILEQVSWIDLLRWLTKCYRSRKKVNNCWLPSRLFHLAMENCPCVDDKHDDFHGFYLLKNCGVPVFHSNVEKPEGNSCNQSLEIYLLGSTGLQFSIHLPTSWLYTLQQTNTLLSHGPYKFNDLQYHIVPQFTNSKC